MFVFGLRPSKLHRLVKISKFGYYTFKGANAKAADQTALMRRLVYALTFRMQQNQLFLR